MNHRPSVVPGYLRPHEGRRTAHTLRPDADEDAVTTRRAAK